MPPHPFVTFLQAKQQKEGLTDARFARERLLISPAQWSMVKNGVRGIGRQLINGAFRAYSAGDDRAIMANALSQPVRVHRQPELGRTHTRQPKHPAPLA